MITVRIKENSKQAKMFAEYAKTLPYVEVISATALNAPAVATKPLTTKQRTLINRLKRIKKDVDNGNMDKFRPIKEILDEINAPVAKPNKLMQDFETACKQLKQSRLRKTKRKSLDELLNEK